MSRSSCTTMHRPTARYPCCGSAIRRSSCWPARRTSASAQATTAWLPTPEANTSCCSTMTPRCTRERWRLLSVRHAPPVAPASSPCPSTTGKAATWSTAAACWIPSAIRSPIWTRSGTEVAYVIGACMFLPRTVWNDLGGLPEWFESIAEDMYLCGLARLRGLPVTALAASGYRHRQGATFGGNRADSGIKTSIKRRRLSERNKTRVLMILTPSPLMWPLLFLHLILLTMEGVVLSMLRGDTALLRDVYGPALVTPFREWIVLGTRRREVQAARIISTRQWLSTARCQLRKVVMLLRYGVPKVR